MDKTIRCSKSVMDTQGDPDITFNEYGVCNYYEDAESRYSNFVYSPEESETKLIKLANEIKQEGKGNEYDCIIGLSGGVDSSYVAIWAVEMGLRPLAVHFDNGWNSEIAVNNIKKIIDKLGIDLYTYVVNWDEFADLQRSFFKASVVDVEMITDNSHKAVTVSIAKEYGIKYNLHGGNFRTENMMPPSWSWNKQDVLNIKDIHKKYGTRPLKTFKTISDLRWEFIKRTGFSLKLAMPLNLMNFRKDEAMDVLKEKVGWEYYGGKHYESVFTKFFQAYYLPEKFKIDKRKVHLSSLILNNEISREEAIIEISKPLYQEEELRRDKEYVLKKLGFSKDEWSRIMTEPVRSHDYYSSNVKFRNALTSIYNKFKGK